MAHCADRPLVSRSDNGKWRTVVLKQNSINWSYTCLLALLTVCSFIGHKSANDFVIHYGRLVQFCLHSCLPPILTLNTNPTLHLTLPATHRPAAVLLLLTWQQLTVWQLKGMVVGGRCVLGNVMEPLYFLTEWGCYEGKMQQLHIKQFNVHNQHLPPSELCSPVPPSVFRRSATPMWNYSREYCGRC